MRFCNEYTRATSVEHALSLLENARQPARLVGGGTDFLLELQQGLKPPVETLVDITDVPEMLRIETRDNELFVGAAATHARIASSPEVVRHAQALAEACGLVGGPQVRNMGTIGGNIGHALPAADGTIAAMALGAQAEIATQQGRHRVDLGTLFAGPGKSTLDPTAEILIGVYLPLKQAGQASAFGRVMRPQGVAVAILNMAIWMQRSGNLIDKARVVVGPSGPTPRFMKTAQSFLEGRHPDEDTVQGALDAILQEARLRTSPHRATSEYRQHLVGVLLVDLLMNAWERTQH